MNVGMTCCFENGNGVVINEHRMNLAVEIRTDVHERDSRSIFRNRIQKLLNLETGVYSKKFPLLQYWLRDREKIQDSNIN
jgi:hypothetical protein